MDLSDNTQTDEAHPKVNAVEDGGRHIKLASGIAFTTIWRGAAVAHSHEPKSGETMRSLFSRTNNSSLDTSETFNVKLAEVEGAVREMVQPDADPSNPEEAPREVTAANVNVLVQRAASLSELQDIIRELQKLHDFLHSEGERLEQEISKYAQLSKTTTTSTRLIANTILKSLRSEQ